MEVVLFIVAFAAAVQLCKYLWRRKHAWRVGVRWSNAMTAPLPPTVVRSVVTQYLRANGWALGESHEAFDIYERGDLRVASVPSERRLSWHDVPIVLGVSFFDRPGETSVEMTFRALTPVRFSVAGIKFFTEHTNAEFEGALASLNQVLRERVGAQGEEHSRNGSQERPWWSERRESDNADDADLASLGLKRGASWEQLQAAYRDACRKYHPDRLMGSSVEPHLVELATDRFKEISAAYQRLRERAAQPQR